MDEQHLENRFFVPLALHRKIKNKKHNSFLPSSIKPWMAGRDFFVVRRRGAPLVAAQAAMSVSEGRKGGDERPVRSS